MNNIEILLSDSHGIFIPNIFYTEFDLKKWNVSHIDLTSLSDCEDEDYWETWENVLNTAYFVLNGKIYNLHQDGDLLAICYDDLSEDEKLNLGLDD